MGIIYMGYPAGVPRDPLGSDPDWRNKEDSNQNLS